ncbi:hypothetical protein HBI56_105100 [Parastagonospora nodorum]|nr:hypothetical protein HBH56_133810 [Parastagonospora nodorum]KAH3926863.1 hypothetical protein HBH54_159480 [Parastagonospora nodorum]KAH3949500.1 hypothetical protein HBH53_088880 [Parastagonospora nodorum]KAH3974557.1 hypothetical protein HBH52_132860 [Parastagonospora nodorum]KAH3977971.1 hypothetical protein HBH51_067140 [Parastagonospora nodorum]
MNVLYIALMTFEARRSTSRHIRDFQLDRVSQETYIWYLTTALEKRDALRMLNKPEFGKKIRMKNNRVSYGKK